MLALIDGDIVAHRVAWTTENDDFPIARFRADEMLDGILNDTQATEFTVWLSDSKENNFRYKIYPEYKANRDNTPRPRHLRELKEYLITRWSARIAIGMEADDELGIEQVKNFSQEDSPAQRQFGFSSGSVICSIDKDLQQIPGNHYNFVKKEHTFVTPEEAIKYFYSQILTGDSSDNIKGARGIGPVKAEKLLGPLGADDRSLSEAVLNAYIKAFNITTPEGVTEIKAYITKVAQVLKIRQTEDEKLWRFPQENQTQESPSLSLPKMPEAVGPYSGPITLDKNGVLLLGESMGESLKTTQGV